MSPVVDMIVLGSAIIMDFVSPQRRVIENMGSFQKWELASLTLTSLPNNTGSYCVWEREPFLLLAPGAQLIVFNYPWCSTSLVLSFSFASAQFHKWQHEWWLFFSFQLYEYVQEEPDCFCSVGHTWMWRICDCVWLMHVHLPVRASRLINCEQVCCSN